MDIKMKGIVDIWVRDTKRAITRPIKAGEEFSLDDFETIAALVTGLRARIIDERVIPLVAQYRVQFPFEVESNGEVLLYEQGQVINLPQKEACQLMAERKVVPVDKNSWHPFKRVFVSNDVKKMYDEEGGNAY